MWDSFSSFMEKWSSWKQANPRIIKVLFYYGISLLVVFALYICLYLLIYFGAFERIPIEAELLNIDQPVASEIYSADSVLLGKYYIQNRSEVAYEDISPWMIQALICTEDARFYRHSGVDHRSLARVLFKSILLQDRSAGGGSTLSQQLAKNLFPRKKYGILTIPVNKIREAIIARRLERIYTKEEILTLYLNTVSFGESAYGVGTAAKRFFNRSPSELRIEQAATLVGMLKATSFYNPRLHPERAKERRNVVLDQMAKYSMIDQRTEDSLQRIPLELDYQLYTPSDGLAPYFRATIASDIKDILREYARDGGKLYNLYTDGIRIYTTLDSRLQQYAEEAVSEHMQGLQKTFFRHWKDQKPWGNDLSVIERATRRSDRYQTLTARGFSSENIIEAFAKPSDMRVFSWEGSRDTIMSAIDSIMYYAQFLNAGFQAVDPFSGEIKAWVGGIDYHYFQYDHVLARRQVGSTFKPIVYAAALENGFSPCKYLDNTKQVYEAYEGWSPGNADGEYGGSYSLAGGLTHSVNTITVSLLMDIGVEAVIRQAYLMGIKSELPEEPSIALGTAELNLSEMLSVYSTFANGGFATESKYLSRVEAADGTVIFEKQEESQLQRRVMSERTAQLMLEMLQAVVDSGTARDIRYRYGIRGPVAGKTGTTQAHADGWFIGFTPHLVAGVWVGAEDPKVRFRSMQLGQGAKTALPIWAKFMQRVKADPSLKTFQVDTFSQTDIFTLSELDCPMYMEEQEEDRNFFFKFRNWVDEWKDRRKMDREDRIELRNQRRKERRKLKHMMRNQSDRYGYLTPEERRKRLKLKQKYGYRDQ